MVSGVPPFERFYETHKGEVLAFLRGRAGRDREVLDLDELDPLDVTDDGRSHDGHAHRSTAPDVGRR